MLSERIMVGIVIRPTQYYVSQGVPAFRSANIREDGINNLDLVFISEASNALLAKSQTRTGDILTVRTGYPGTSAVVRPPHASCNCIDILITRPSKKINSDYLVFWINSSFGKEQILRNQGGLAQQHFNVGDMRSLLVALPSLTEQRSIATALSDMDELLGGLDRLITKKRDLKQSAMQQLLTGKTRLPGFDGEWEMKKIGDTAICFSGGTPSTHISAYYDGEIPWVTSSDLNRGYIDTVKGRISQLGLTNSAAKTIEPDTLLIALYGATSGVTAISKIHAAINQAVLAIAPHQDSTTFLYFKLSFLKNWLISTYTQGGQPNLSGEIVKSIELSIPPLPEQNAIASILSDMDTEITILEQRRNKTRDLKQAMMQELLTGRIRLL
jgi:type I restriction enzyme, S subunit